VKVNEEGERGREKNNNNYKKTKRCFNSKMDEKHSILKCLSGE
jgi:hypothetical protein